MTRYVRAFMICALVAMTARPASAGSDQSQPAASSPASREVTVPNVGACAPSCGRPVSPNGRYLAYRDRDAEKGTQLVIRDLVSGKDVRVVPQTPDNQPSGDLVWSRDSTRLAYRWLGKDGQHEIRSVDADGSNDRALAAKGPYLSLLDWSPDGASMVVRATESTAAKSPLSTVLLSLAAGSKRALGRGDVQAAVFSNDGRFVAYTQEGSESGTTTADVRLVGVAGEDDRALVATAAYETLLGWSPDGTEILFTRDGDLLAIGVSNGSAGRTRVLENGLGQVKAMGITNAGDVYYRAFDNPRVFRVSLDPASGNVAGRPARVGLWSLVWQESPAWSPDGRELAVTELEDADAITIVSVDTGTQRQVQPGIDWAKRMGMTRFSWSPDGRFFMVDGGPSPEGTARPKGAYRVDVRTGEATMVVSKTPNPVSVSRTRALPDGRSLIFLDTYRRVVVRNLESGDERVVFDCGPDVTIDSLIASPDGRSAAFHNQKQGVIQVVPLAGGAPRTVASVKVPEDSAAAIAWSGDGRWLIYASQTPGTTDYELRRVAVAGGASQRMGLVSHGEIADVATRPGGRELAIVMQAGDAPGVRVIEHLLPAAGPR